MTTPKETYKRASKDVVYWAQRFRDDEKSVDAKFKAISELRMAAEQVSKALISMKNEDVRSV